MSDIQERVQSIVDAMGFEVVPGEIGQKTTIKGATVLQAVTETDERNLEDIEKDKLTWMLLYHLYGPVALALKELIPIVERSWTPYKKQECKEILERLNTILKDLCYEKYPIQTDIS